MLTSEDIRQIRTCAFKGTPYRADVQVTLDELLTAAENGASRTQVLSELATGSPNMTDVVAEVVDFKGDRASTLIIQVSGRVEQVAQEIAAAQMQEG